MIILNLKSKFQDSGVQGPKFKKNYQDTLFYNQFLAYEALPNEIKNKIENLEGVFSSQGKIARTRVQREVEHGTNNTKEIRSKHKLVQSIDDRKAIYCSPGHIVGIANQNSDQKSKIENLKWKRIMISAQMMLLELLPLLLHLVQLP